MSVALLNQAANYGSGNNTRWWYYSVNNYRDVQLFDEVCQRFVTAVKVGDVHRSLFDEGLKVHCTFGWRAKSDAFHFAG